jgi:N-acetylmuramoyl-L-alanine amidase
VKPKEGEGYAVLAQRYLGSDRDWRRIREANGGREAQTGRAVRIPVEMLPPERRLQVLTSLFPNDAYRDGGWSHVTGQPSARRCRETAEDLAVWFTGAASRGPELARRNSLGSGPFPAGTRLQVPRDLLLPIFAPAVSQAEATLAYGKDEDGEYAIYRLQPGEALYSSVVIRFSGRLDADEVNDLAADIARRSGIANVRDIPVGFPVKIPFDLLLPQFLPPEHPDRIAYEAERLEASHYQVQVTAPRLQGVNVILDAGHGGIDVGTTHDGMDEDEYAYDVLCRIKRLLDHDTAAMTLTTIEDKVTAYTVRDEARLARDRNEQIRTTPPLVPRDPSDRALGVNLRWYLANSYYRRLVERGIDANKIVFLSLHADSLHPSLQGVMVYVPGEEFRSGRYGSSDADYAAFAEVREQEFVSFARDVRLHSEGVSRQLADILIGAYQRQGMPVHDYQPVRDRVIRRKRTWVPAVIRCSEVPVSLLIELGNLNNEADRRHFRDPAFRERLAQGVVAALMRFYDGADAKPRDDVKAVVRATGAAAP